MAAVLCLLLIFVRNKNCACRLLPLQAFWVYMINIGFSALAFVHLTYLGSVFSSSVDYTEEDEVSGG